MFLIALFSTNSEVLAVDSLAVYFGGAAAYDGAG
jgi:hypothetical protein